MDFLAMLYNWIEKSQGIIFLVCPPIIFMYVGYRIGTRGKFFKLRKQVLDLQKKSKNKNRFEFNYPEKVRVLSDQIIRARNFEQITEFEKNYLTDTVNQIMQRTVYFSR